MHCNTSNLLLKILKHDNIWRGQFALASPHSKFWGLVPLWFTPMAEPERICILVLTQLQARVQKFFTQTILNLTVRRTSSINVTIMSWSCSLPPSLIYSPSRVSPTATTINYSQVCHYRKSIFTIVCLLTSLLLARLHIVLAAD